MVVVDVLLLFIHSFDGDILNIRLAFVCGLKNGSRVVIACWIYEASQGSKVADFEIK